jgi:nitrogen fixation protein NifQ
MNGPDRHFARDVLVAELLLTPCPAPAAGDPNRPLLASLLAGQTLTQGCLPADLGIGGTGFREMLASHFPGNQHQAMQRPVDTIPELDDLKHLLREHRAHEHASEDWMVDILATACAGRDHLWQDLGLSCREELTRLMWVNFPSLARANSGDMKWKKFLYRQMCAGDGTYVCPAPSCGVCLDYTRCFGPEN